MGYERPGLELGMFAADVAMPNGQFTPVWLGASAVSGSTWGTGKGNAALVLMGSNLGPPLGILQQPLRQGEPGNVMVSGESKAKYGGTIAVNDVVTWDATGLLIIKATTGKIGIGRAVEAGVNGDIGTIHLQPLGVQ